MKAGEVVHLRVNPEDVMGCIDLVRARGLYIPGMSIAQVVRLSLSGLLEAARIHEIIPRRDGFEYSQMLQPFQTGRNGRKLQITSAVESAEAARTVLDLPATPMEVSFRSQSAADKAANELFDQLAARKARLLIAVTELTFKQEADPMNFGAEEQSQLTKALKEIEEINGEMQEIQV